MALMTVSTINSLAFMLCSGLLLLLEPLVHLLLQGALKARP
jgi:hypothetical protein